MLARAFGVDPDAVLNEWDEDMYQDALDILSAETRYHERTGNAGR